MSRDRCAGLTRARNKCGNYPIIGRKYCRSHGGKSLTGKNHPNYIHGKYSEYAPSKNVQDTYLEMLNDPNLLGVRPDIALVQTRMMQLFGGIRGEGEELWSELSTTWEDFRLAVAQKDAVKQGALLLALDTIITNGADDQTRWRELVKLSEVKRRHVDSERRYMLQSEMMISMEQMYMLQNTLMDQIASVLTDKVGEKQALSVLYALEEVNRKAEASPVRH